MSKQDPQLSAELSGWRQRGQSQPVESSAEEHSNLSAARGHGGSGQMSLTPRMGQGLQAEKGTAGKDSRISRKAREEPWWFIRNCQGLGLGSDTPGQHSVPWCSSPREIMVIPGVANRELPGLPHNAAQVGGLVGTREGENWKRMGGCRLPNPPPGNHKPRPPRPSSEALGSELVQLK